MREEIEAILLDEARIKSIVARLGAEISRDYRGQNLWMVSVLKGSVIFMADLMRAIKIPCAVDFMVVSSYGAGVKTGGTVKIRKDLDVDVAGLDVLVVEDILDSGITLRYLWERLAARHPKSIRLCAFLDKPDRRMADVRADYVGAVIPDVFVVGYGLDYNERYRNLPYVGILKREMYE